jgi:NAD(P)H-hydrate epimerase
MQAHCNKITKKIFNRLFFPKPNSHKYQNGLVLVIAGSKQYHGSLVFSAVTASRLVDLVFVCTAPENFQIIKKYSPAFIVNDYSAVLPLAKRVDSILIGPGIEENKKMKSLVEKIVLQNKNKKIVLDATALRLVEAKKLHSNCCVTPHAKEFVALFGCKPTQKNVFAMAKKYSCVVCLKGKTDFVSDGKKLYCNFTGNSGMTKGGTGDTLAGLVVGFAAKSSLLDATIASCYLNGFAGDLLLKERGFMFNATDLMEKLPFALKILKNKQ